MAWRSKESKSKSSQAGASSQADEKLARLQATLDKIQDPLPTQSLVGAVVHADGKIEGQHVAAAHTNPNHSTTSVTGQAPPPNEASHNVKQPNVAPHVPGNTTGVHSASSSERLESKGKDSNGPLNKKDVIALGNLLKKEKKDARAEPVLTPVIAPTDPDPEGTIAAHIAEKKMAEEQAAAEAEAKKWHVSQAKIHEARLNRKKMYTYAAYWLGAVPVAYILYLIVQSSHGDDARGIARLLIMTPIYIVGSYGLVGWIPLVLEYLKTQKG